MFPFSEKKFSVEEETCELVRLLFQVDHYEAEIRDPSHSVIMHCLNDSQLPSLCQQFLEEQ